MASIDGTAADNSTRHGQLSRRQREVRLGINIYDETVRYLGSSSNLAMGLNGHSLVDFDADRCDVRVCHSDDDLSDRNLRGCVRARGWSGCPD
jgi:hypothetical protein